MQQLPQIVQPSLNPLLLAFSIVTYKEIFYETNAYQALVKSLAAIQIPFTSLILIHDNTDTPDWHILPIPQQPGIEVFYHHDATNPGISKAYNFIAQVAKDKGYLWILFMDQDTLFPGTFVASYITAIQQRPQILIKTPLLIANEKIFSPALYRFRRGKRVKQIAPGIKPFGKYIFVNSGLLVNLELFFRVGGYNERVKLDFADFLFLDRVRKTIAEFELLNVTGHQSFSFFEYDINKALKRYTIFKKDLDNCPRHTLGDTIGYAMVGWSYLIKSTLKYKTLRFLKIKFASNA